MLYIFSALYILIVIWAVIALESKDNKKYLRAKTCASMGFLVLGIYAFQVTGSELYLSFLPAYICCFVGDVLLGIAHEKKQFFLPGMLVFLASHFIYIGLFFGERGGAFVGYPMWIVLSFFVGTLTIISSFFPKWMQYGSKKIPCIIYAYTVGMCGGCGIDLLIEHGLNNAGYVMLGIGAFIFMLSDCVLCLKYFKVNKKAWHPPFVTISYYIALYLISTFYLFI